MTKNIIIKNKARKSFKSGSGIAVLNRVVSKRLVKKASFDKRFKGSEGTS